jgi:hypothetical protein
MSLEHLTVVQEQSHVPKMSMKLLMIGELQKVMLYLNTKHGLIQFKNNATN